MAAFVLRDFFRQVRTRADEGHRAGKDEEELGQFVDRQAADELADAGDARIVLDLHHRPVGTDIAVGKFGVAQAVHPVEHRAEFQVAEFLAALADAIERRIVVELREEDRAAGIELDGDRGQDHDRARQDDEDERTDDVEDALGDPSPAVERSLLHFDDRQTGEFVDFDAQDFRLKQVGGVLECQMMLVGEVEETQALGLRQVRVGLQDFIDFLEFEEGFEVGGRFEGKVVIAFDDDIAEIAADGKFADEPVSSLSAADDDDVMDADAVNAERPADIRNDHAAEPDIEDREEPAGHDDEARGEQVALEEDVDDDGDQPERAAEDDFLQFSFEATQFAQVIESAKREDDEPDEPEDQ